MRPLDPTKDRMKLEIDQQLRAFLKRGGKIEELPAPGSGHTLEKKMNPSTDYLSAGLVIERDHRIAGAAARSKYRELEKKLHEDRNHDAAASIKAGAK